MSNDHFRLEQEIIERIKSMVFLCLNCNNKKPTAASVIDFGYHATGPNATAFLFVIIAGINSP